MLFEEVIESAASESDGCGCFLLKNFVVLFARLDNGLTEDDDDEEVEAGDA